METKLLCASSYGLLSLYRSRLMGLAMLFHAYELKFGLLPLDAFKAAGFAGVDVFFLLSGMGLYVSLSQANKAGAIVRILRTPGCSDPAVLLACGGNL
nr:hypothetical protein [uncultured Oscillibacter sp.]